MSAYCSDETCSCLHCAQASIPYFQRQDLGAWGHAISFWLLWEVTCCYTGNVSPMCTCKAKNLTDEKLERILIKNCIAFSYPNDHALIKTLLNNKNNQEPKHICPPRWPWCSLLASLIMGWTNWKPRCLGQIEFRSWLGVFSQLLTVVPNKHSINNIRTSTSDNT